MKVIRNSARVNWANGTLNNNLYARVSSSSIPYPDTIYPVWVSTTSYTVGSRATEGDKIYTCIAPSSGPQPSARTDLWRCEGAAERYKMLDFSAATQSSYGASGSFVIAGDIVDSMVFLNVTGATSITVNAVVTATGVNVYSKTFDMTLKTDLVLMDIPSGSLTITVTLAGTAVKIGNCFWGKQTDIGGTQYGASASINDYSTQSTDIYGNTALLRRVYSKRLSVNLMIPNANVDKVFMYLADNRTTPMVWVGDDNYGTLAVYGVYKDFAINIAYPDYSSCSLTIEGLA